MGEMRKFRVGDTLEGVPVGTINAHTDYVLQQRSKLDTFEDVRKPKQKSPVVVQLIWSGGSDLAAGSCVKLGNAVFDPGSVAGAEFSGLSFYIGDFAKIDLSSPYAVTLGPISDGSGTPQVGYGFIPNCTWAKVNIIDTYHKYALPTADGHVLKSGWTGARILWQESGAGEKWAIVQMARGPQHLQLGVITDIDSSGPVTGYSGTADATFSLGNFSVVKLLLLDVGNEFDVSTSDLEVLDSGAAGMPTSGKVVAYDVRKEGTPKVGDVVRVWASTGEYVAPGDGQRNTSATPPAGHQWIYCDVLNVGDYLRGLSTYNVANYQVLIHQDASSSLEWADVTDVVTEGGGGGGSGTVTSVSAGYAIDISGTATDPVVDFDPTEITSYSTTAFQIFAHEPTADGGPTPVWWTISSYDETKKQSILQSAGALSFEDAHKVRSTVNDTTAAFLHDAIKDNVAGGTYVSGKDALVKAETDGASATNQTERFFLDASAISGYAASTVQLLGKDSSDNLKWDTIANWLTLLANHNSSHIQSVGHDNGGAPEWQDDGSC